MKRLFIILFLASVCNATAVFDRDIYNVMEKKYHRSILESMAFVSAGTTEGQLLYWDAIASVWLYADVTKLKWDDTTDILLIDTLNLTNALDVSDYINLIAGTNITLAGDTLNVDDAFLINDGDDMTTGTLTAAGFTDGIFIVSGGEISAGEIIATFGDIDIGGNTLTSWDIFTGQIVSHSTSDPQLLLRHTTGVDEAGFYVDSDGDLTITPTGDMILPIHVIIDELTAGASTLGDGGTTDYTAFSNRGEMTMHGNARVGRHLVIGGASWRRGATAPTETYENIFPTISFNPGQNDEAHYTTIVPHWWDDTTDMEVEIHWKMSNVADTGKVLWKLKYIAVKEGENPAGAGTEIVQLSAGNHPEDELLETYFTMKMLATNLESEDSLGLMLWRNGTDGSDNLGEDAELIALHIHYVMNQLGQPLVVPENVIFAGENVIFAGEQVEYL